MLKFILSLLIASGCFVPSYAEWITVETSAYTGVETYGNPTATGEIPYEGGVACNFIPLGTKIQIDGIDYIVNDICGIDGCIDIFMHDYQRAIEWGRRVKQVFIYR